jgi:hypothetical protein
MKKQTCEFIPVSKVVPQWLAKKDFWENISDGAPFSWGDNNRTLVTASRFADHCQYLVGQTKKAQSFMRKLERLGDTYIDLEN